MITPKTQSNVFTSGIEETKAFKIKNSGKGFAILTANLYSNKVGAILRELGCNAIDAHKDAGTSDKNFIVHLPNQLEPEFYIRDFGTGISESDMETVYTVLFESTKENSNDQIGCLGLGSKTPFAYTDNFFVTCFQKGVKKVYNVFMDEMGTPSYSKVFEGDTSDPDGLMVKFAVDGNDVWRFKEEAQNIYSYFDKKPEIKGQQVEWKDFGKPLMEIAGCQIFEKSYYSNRNAKVVMGNIAYPIDGFIQELRVSESETDSLISSFISSYNFILNAPIGSFDIVPSREEISFNAITIKNLRKILGDVIREINIEVSRKAKEIADMDSYLESCYQYNKFVGALESFHRNFVEKMKLTHKSGASFLQRVELGSDIYEKMEKVCDDNKLKHGCRLYFINKPHSSQNLSFKLQVGFNVNSAFNEETVFYSVDLKKEKNVARRIKGFLLDHNNNAKYLVLIPKEVKSLYRDEAYLTDDMIKDFNLPNVQIQRKASSGSTFEDRVTKDSVRVSSVIANEIDDFEVSREDVITRHCDNIYYTAFYRREFPYKEFMEEVVEADEYCVIYLERHSFIEKIEEKWESKTWVNLDNEISEYISNLSDETKEAFVNYHARKEMVDIHSADNEKCKFLMDDEAKCLVDMIEEAQKLGQSNIKLEGISELDSKILNSVCHGYFSLYSYGGISNHNMVRFMDSASKAKKMVEFYFEHSPDADENRLDLQDFYSVISGRESMSILGHTYEWKEVVKKMIEEKLEKGVDTKAEDVV